MGYVDSRNIEHHTVPTPHSSPPRKPISTDFNELITQTSLDRKVRFGPNNVCSGTFHKTQHNKLVSNKTLWDLSLKFTAVVRLWNCQNYRCHHYIHPLSYQASYQHWNCEETWYEQGKRCHGHELPICIVSVTTVRGSHNLTVMIIRRSAQKAQHYCNVRQ